MRTMITAFSLTVLGTVSLTAAAIEPYRAVIDFKRGMIRAEMQEQLTASGEDYVYDSVARGKGFAAIARSRPAEQHSRFRIDERGDVVPLHFSVDDGTRKGEKSTTIVYDWAAGKASVTTSEGVVELPLEKGTLDVYTVGLQFQLDLQRGGADARYRVIDGDRLREYVYTMEGEDTVEVPLGVYAAHRYRLEREARGSILHFWHVPSLDYLSVRTEESKGGRSRYTMEMRSLSGVGE